MIYHILPEWEPFSAFRGGAVSHIVASIMQLDSSNAVVCAAADETWGFGPDRVLALPPLLRYRKIRGRHFLPIAVHRPLLRRIFKPLVEKLDRGDIVWCHGQPTFCASLAQSIQSRGAKLVYHAHSSLAPWYVRSKLRRSAADAHIFVSEALQREAIQCLPQLSNTHFIHNGVDPDRFYPLAAGEKRRDDAVPIILFVGRLIPEKGVHFLIRAVEILRERGIEAHCRVVGSSFAGGGKVTPYVKMLRRSSPSNVSFEGFRAHTEIVSEYRQADIVCCPSVSQDPFPGVPLEAMACGVPVVATRVGGIPEIAVDGGVLLVEPKSALQLADALQKLIEAKDFRVRVAADGLGSFQRHFTLAKSYGRYREIANVLMHTDGSAL